RTVRIYQCLACEFEFTDLRMDEALDLFRSQADLLAFPHGAELSAAGKQHLSERRSTRNIAADRDPLAETRYPQPGKELVIVRRIEIPYVWHGEPAKADGTFRAFVLSQISRERDPKLGLLERF